MGFKWRRRRRRIPTMTKCVSRTMVLDSMFVITIVSLFCWAIIGLASGAALAQNEDNRCDILPAA